MFLELLTSDTLLRHSDERPGQDGQQMPLKMRKKEIWRGSDLESNCLKTKKPLKCKSPMVKKNNCLPVNTNESCCWTWVGTCGNVAKRIKTLYFWKMTDEAMCKFSRVAIGAGTLYFSNAMDKTLENMNAEHCKTLPSILTGLTCCILTLYIIPQTWCEPLFPWQNDELLPRGHFGNNQQAISSMGRVFHESKRYGKWMNMWGQVNSLHDPLQQFRKLRIERLQQKLIQQWTC